MSFKKVVIPCAGTGSRLGTFTKSINKALITIGNLPVISRVIDQFPEDITVVIVLGYKGYELKAVLEAFYPKRKFIFETVSKYEGPGSGLTISLRAVEKHLQEPFYFIPNDTIVKNSSFDGFQGNFVTGVKASSYPEIDINQYRTITLGDNLQPISINRKGVNSPYVYVGFAGIHDYASFWDGMKYADDTTGEAAGIVHMMNSGLAFEYYNPVWLDTGNPKSLNQVKKDVAVNSNDFNILDKDGESIWFYDSRVIKFSTDVEFIKNRVNRAKSLPTDVNQTNITYPKLIDYNMYTYQYDFITAQTVSQSIEEGTFGLEDFVTILEHVDDIEKDAIDKVVNLDEFYKYKTVSRLKSYFNRFELTEVNDIINGVPYGKVLEDIESGVFDYWFEMLTTESHLTPYYHGDFHFENILKNDRDFTLIDWRQNFISVDGKDVGDTNYDYAKLLHGLYVSHLQVHLGNYHVKHNKSNEVIFDIKTSLMYSKMIDKMRSMLGEDRFRLIKFLTGIIFLNIAALHDPFEYCQLLYYMGKTLVFDTVNEGKK